MIKTVIMIIIKIKNLFRKKQQQEKFVKEMEFAVSSCRNTIDSNCFDVRFINQDIGR